MTKINLLAIFTFAFFLQNFILNAFSQGVIEEKIVEKNLPEMPKKATSNNKKPDLLTQKNPVINSDEIANTLLGSGTTVNKKIVSLMFDDEELNEIERALDSFKNGQIYNSDKNAKNSDKKTRSLTQENENQKSYIYLASIIYYSQKDWAVWINNTKVTSENNSSAKELFVKEIYPDRVKIVWSLNLTKWKILLGKKADNITPKLNAKNNVEILFTLKPNQTFILGSGLVIEGRAVNNSTK